jgi:hypothetical protein
MAKGWIIVTELQFEKGWPYLLAAVVVVVWGWPLGQPFPMDYTALMGVSGTVAAVLLGFLSAAKAIVLGLTGSEVFQRLKSAGYHDILLGYIRIAVYGSMLLLVVSLVGLFVEPNQNPQSSQNAQEIFKYFWILSGSFSLFAFLRITNHLFKLIRTT